MSRARYTATAERSGKWWAIEVPEVPGVFTQTKRLDQVETTVRDALSLMLEVPEDSFDVAVVPRLNGEAESLLRDLAEARDALARAELRSQAATRQAAAVLHGQFGLSTRDTGAVMGVSFQRVAQLTGER